MLTLDAWTVERLFHRVADDDGNPIYWMETNDEEGYILVWPDGERHHTYHRPFVTFRRWAWGVDSPEDE